MENENNQFCTFHVDSLFLGIDVQQVQEVIRYQEMTSVPLAPDAVSGLINLRGQIVTAIDLRCRLGLPLRQTDELPMNVVVRDGDNAVSLLVDRIGDVVEVDNDLLESPPATMPENVHKIIRGVYKLPDGLLLVLDTNETLAESDSRVKADTRVAS